MGRTAVRPYGVRRGVYYFTAGTLCHSWIKCNSSPSVRQGSEHEYLLKYRIFASRAFLLAFLPINGPRKGAIYWKKSKNISSIFLSQ